MKWGLSFVVLFLFASIASSQEIGKVKYVVSPVTVVRDGAADIAAPDRVLRLNDIVRTGQNGRARLVLLDGSELTLGPLTELRVVVDNPEAQQTTIELLYGRLRAHVTSVTKAGGIFQVRTPVGIAVALGSELEVDTVAGAGNLIETAQASSTNVLSREDLKNIGQATQLPLAIAPAGQSAALAQLTDQAADAILGRQQGWGSLSGAPIFVTNNGVSNGSVSGQSLRRRNNDQQIDGQNNNDNSVGGPGLFLSDSEFVQQYVLVTNQFGPEFGRNSSPAVNIIINSGNNAWRGGLYGNENKNILNPLPSGYIPLDFSGYTDPSRPWLYTGSPIRAGDSGPNSGFTYTPRLITNPNFGSNWTFINNDSMLGSDTITSRYLFNRGNNFNVGENGSQGWLVNPSALSQSMLLSWTHNLTAHLVNESRLNFNRLNVDFGGNGSIPGGGLQIGQNFTFNPQYNFPIIPFSSRTIQPDRIEYPSWWNDVIFRRLNTDFGGNGNIPGGGSQIGKNFTFNPQFNFPTIPSSSSINPPTRIVNTWQSQDNWNYVLGRHQLKSGVNWTYQRSPNIFIPGIPASNFPPNIYGGIYFPGITPNPGLSAFQPVIAPSLDFNQYDTFLFAGDDWKIRQNLTLNPGLTWSYYGQPSNLFNTVAPPTAQFPTPRNSFGPSAGFAYSPQWGGFLTGHGKTTFRGGYRFLYDPPFNNIYMNNNVADFSGNDAANVFAGSNPHTNRLRLHWVDMKHDKWEFLGGQFWGLQAPSQTDLFDPFLTHGEDAQVHVGVPYSRAGQFRTNYHFNDNFLFPSGDYNALMPFTNPLPNITAPAFPLTSLGQIPSGAVPGNGTGLNLTNFNPVIGMHVTALDHYAAVLPWIPGSKATYAKPGQMISVDRGKMPGPPIPSYSDFVAGRAARDTGTLNEIHFEEFDSSGKLCVPNIVVDGVAQNPSAASTFTYTVSGNNTSTGTSALKLDVTNSGTCPLYFLTTFGAVFKPSSTAHQIGAVAGILLGGDLNLNDVKSYQLLDSFGGFLIVPPIQVAPSATSSKSGPSDLPEEDSNAVYSPEIPPGAASMFLRSYCLELHKLAPHTNTRYRFADNDIQQKLSSNGSIISRIFDMVQARLLDIPKGHTLDSLIQWTLWASREGMDEKKFREAYMTLARHNYEAQKKWNKDMQRQLEESADVLWPIIQKVLSGI